jgi:serine/threonine protein kinase
MDQEGLPPHRIGRYVLLEPLGSGTMGSVYLAAHETLTRQRFAIKTLNGTLAGHRGFTARFQREAELAARLSHPNLVPVVDFGVMDDGVPFLVMKHVVGPSLRDVIARDAPLGLERTASIVRQLALALAHVHGRGLVHRDVKPANVIVTTEDGREVPRLLDFGMVGTLDDDALARLTADGMTLGTPLYMAPEQVHDSQVGPGADLYALGVTLHEMLTGRPPFIGRAEAVAAAKVSADVAPLEERTGLEHLAWRLLAPHPADRLQTAREVVVAIDEVLTRGAPSVARSMTVAQCEASAGRAVSSRSRVRQAASLPRGVVIAATLLGATAVGALVSWFAGSR